MADQLTDGDIAEWLRERIRELPIQTVVASHVSRPVRDRNTAQRPQTMDAVLLDDIWRVVDELAVTGASRPCEITDEMVQRAAREMHQQQGGHPAGWDGHCLAAAKVILVAALRAQDTGSD